MLSYSCRRSSGQCYGHLEHHPGSMSTHIDCQSKCISYHTAGQIRRVDETMTELRSRGFRVEYDYMIRPDTSTGLSDHIRTIGMFRGVDTFTVYARFSDPTTPPIVTKNSQLVQNQSSLLPTILMAVPETVATQPTLQSPRNPTTTTATDTSPIPHSSMIVPATTRTRQLFTTHELNCMRRACNGKPKSAGGLNIDQIRQYLRLCGHHVHDSTSRTILQRSLRVEMNRFT
jgi:hypothetical protein